MFQFSEESIIEIKRELARYETKESAIIRCLYIAQKANQGWINNEVIISLSKEMDIPESRINEVFKFYTLFNQKAVGKYHIQVCTNISCALNGSRELTQQICSELKASLGEMTEDGRFTVSKVECLGSCGSAPMMQVNDKYYENLTAESAMNILRGMK